MTRHTQWNIQQNIYMILNMDNASTPSNIDRITHVFINIIQNTDHTHAYESNIIIILYCIRLSEETLIM